MEAECKIGSYADCSTTYQSNLKSAMLAFDIHSAYHHVDIYEPHTEFVCVSWTVNGCRILFFIIQNLILYKLRDQLDYCKEMYQGNELI